MFRDTKEGEYAYGGSFNWCPGGLLTQRLTVPCSARALDLDFIPRPKERYDLFDPAGFETDAVRRLISIIAMIRIRETVRTLGVYDVSEYRGKSVKVISLRWRSLFFTYFVDITFSQ
jgi:hypothetical protein